MIQEWASRLSAAIESSRLIEHGTQYIFARGAERAILNVYSGARGTRYLVQRPGPLADELRRLILDATAAALPPTPWNVWCGSDESGKGDFLGPLTVAAVAVTRENAPRLAALGVRDCKTLSDLAVRELDEKIRAGHPFKLVGWLPEEYNRRYEQAGDVNRLLGLAHAEAIDGVLKNASSMEAAVVDQFGDENLVKHALLARGTSLKLVQRPRADETDIAVAAASIVARAAFVRGLEKLQLQYGIRLCKGAGDEVIASARAFVHKHGRDRLGCVAKLHFKTTSLVGR
ncbi:MAG: ribonuclease HIII [Planctomycetes bacterium]|nr:ribonuclease HIII [Planctomycetota bacterium]